jgi:phosphoglycolate phosphatase
MENRYKGVVFDFDGTLADTFPGIYEAWKRTFENLNLGPISPERVRKAIGPTKDAYLRIILDDKFESHGQAALDSFRAIYKGESIFTTGLYPGIQELLDRLDGTGTRMAIASNKPHGQVVKLIEHLGVADYFCPVLGPEKVKEGKPAPDMFLECARDWGMCADRILVAGDTELDMIAGRSAGMARAAVLWGYSDEGLLALQAPDYAVATPAALGEVILKTPEPVGARG